MFITIVFISFLFFIYSVSIRKIIIQRNLFNKATQRAKQTGKRLLVIGCPRAGLSNRLVRTYTHGDICLDIDGCSLCVKYDINQNLQDFANDSFVLYESGVFSFSNNFIELIKNVNRITGGDFYMYGSNSSSFFRIIGRRIYQKWIQQPVLLAVDKYEPGDSDIEFYDYNHGVKRKIDMSIRFRTNADLI